MSATTLEMPLPQAAAERRPSWFTQVFGRITSSGRFVPVVDGLRFVAIAAVLLYHLEGYVAAKSPYIDAGTMRSEPLNMVLRKGACGVQLFFAISGFILAVPFAEEFLRRGKRVELSKFYFRRLTRLAPPYVINLLLSFALLVLAGKATAVGLFPHLVASTFYVHNLVFGEMSLVNGVAWSLEVEVQFYLLAPFLAAVFRVSNTALRRGLLTAVIGLIVLLKATVFSHLEGLLYFSVLWHFDLFLIGFLLADLHTLNSVPEARSTGWDAVGVLAWAGVLATQFFELGEHLIAIPTFVAYLAVFRGRLLHALFSQRLFVLIGGMCYTIYLYHFYMISAVGRFTIDLPAGTTFTGNYLLQAALICPVVIAASAVLFLLFEKPFMKPLAVRPQPA